MYRDWHHVTGCVATATAQLMYYYRGKERPSGSHSYEWNGQTLSYDYSKTEFDWDNMLEYYKKVVYVPSNKVDSNYTYIQGKAVAELMWACGVGLNMDYAPDGSGAYTDDVRPFLVKNMGYSPEMRLMPRDYFSTEGWRTLLYNELSEGRPMICRGKNHCFICDGYDSGDFYHFNWGWVGSCDGYFSLIDMSPIQESSYHLGMEALVGIEPGKPGDSYWADVWLRNDFTLRKDGLAEMPITISGERSDEVDIHWGVKIVSEDGEQIQYFEAETEMGSIYGPLILPRNIGLSAGRYKVYPAFRSEDNRWRDILCPPYKQNFILLDVGEDGSYNYSNPDFQVPDYDVAITNLSFRGITYVGGVNAVYEFDYTAVNRRDEICNPNVNLVLTSVDDGEVVVKQESEMTIIESSTCVWSFSLFIPTLDPGEYFLDVYDDFGRKINEETMIFTIEPDEGEEPSYDIEVTDLCLKCVDKTSSKPYWTFSCTAINRSNVDCSPAIYGKLKKIGSHEVATFGRGLLEIHACETTQWSFGVVRCGNLAPGEWKLDIYDEFRRKINDKTLYFTIGPEQTGIDIPIADEWDNDAPVEYFDLQGRRVSNPGRGIYIARQGSITRKVSLP